MFINLETLCGFVIVLIAFYYYLTINNNFWKNRGIPGPKPTIGFGNMWTVMFGKESFSQLLTTIYNKYKDEPMIGIFFRRRPVLLLKDFDLIKDVLIKDFSKFANRGFLKTNPKVPLTNHLFALEVKRWRPLRNHLSPVFTSGKLKGTFAQILNCSNDLVTHIDTLSKMEDSINMREVAAKFTTDVIGSCVFGIKMNSLSEIENEFRRIGRNIFATNFTNILKIRLLQSTPFLHSLLCKILPDEEMEMFMRITKETMEYREKNNLVRPDFMNILLELKKHPERIADIELTDDLLAAQAYIFFAAGFETSSTTISNALYELALNHDMQDKLREEIKEFEAKNDGEWRYETIKEMQYLGKIFQETLRKYPALSFLSRESIIDDYTFRDTKLTISKGTLVWIPVFPIHHDPNIYPDPEKFDPERFTEDKIKERNLMHYFPFGHGPRNCIGARFAIYQTKIGLIKILRNYKVDVCSKTLIPYKYDPFSFILVPLGGLYLKITRIQD